MKMIVENKDAEGLEALLGEQVFLMCAFSSFTHVEFTPTSLPL